MNVTEATGYTPLHMAARWGRARAVQRLLELGADAEATDKVGVSLSVSVGGDGVCGVFDTDRVSVGPRSECLCLCLWRLSTVG